MLVQTSRFGPLEVEEKDIVYFPEGIIGFEEAKKFTLFVQEDGGLFKWLQSTDIPELAFVLIQPEIFSLNYSLELSEADVKDLQIEDVKKVEIWAIVVIPKEPSLMTANLQGPIVINREKALGRQVISSNPKHRLRHLILEEMQSLVSAQPKTDDENGGS